MRKANQLKLARSLSANQICLDKNINRQWTKVSKKLHLTPKVFSVDKDTEKFAKSLWIERESFNEIFEQQLGVDCEKMSKFDLNDPARLKNKESGLRIYSSSAQAERQVLSLPIGGATSQQLPNLLSPIEENMASSTMSGIERGERSPSKMQKQKARKKRRHSVTSLSSHYSLNHVKSRGNSFLPAVRMAPGAIKLGTEDKIYEYNMLY